MWRNDATEKSRRRSERVRRRLAKDAPSTIRQEAVSEPAEATFSPLDLVRQKKVRVAREVDIERQQTCLKTTYIQEAATRSVHFAKTPERPKTLVTRFTYKQLVILSNHATEPKTRLDLAFMSMHLVRLHCQGADAQY